MRKPSEIESSVFDLFSIFDLLNEATTIDQRRKIIYHPTMKHLFRQSNKCGKFDGKIILQLGMILRFLISNRRGAAHTHPGCLLLPSRTHLQPKTTGVLPSSKFDRLLFHCREGRSTTYVKKVWVYSDNIVLQFIMLHPMQQVLNKYGNQSAICKTLQLQNVHYRTPNGIGQKLMKRIYRCMVPLLYDGFVEQTLTAKQAVNA